MENRRENVPFDPYYFERQGAQRSIVETFQHIYQTNHWSSASVSGAGADQTQTRQLQEALPALARELRVGVLLDLPCGDYSWMRSIALPVADYIGADVVPELIARHQRDFGDATHRFMTLDMTRDPLPAADLLLCRDCWVHLSFDDIRRALGNIRRSPVSFLLTTTFSGCTLNEDITTGDWRPLNLTLAPFHFPPPLRWLDEQCTEGGGRFQDKGLALWAVDSLPDLR